MSSAGCTSATRSLPRCEPTLRKSSRARIWSTLISMLGFGRLRRRVPGLPRQAADLLAGPRARCGGSRDGCRQRTRRQPCSAPQALRRILGLAKQELGDRVRRARACRRRARRGSAGRAAAAASALADGFENRLVPGMHQKPFRCAPRSACGSAPYRRRRRSRAPGRVRPWRSRGRRCALARRRRAPHARSDRASCRMPRRRCAATS